MHDTTETIRRALVEQVNAMEADRERMEAMFGQVWDTDEVQADFEITGFLAPYVVVTRRSDGQRGTLMFQHQPRYYFSFADDK